MFFSDENDSYWHGFDPRTNLFDDGAASSGCCTDDTCCDTGCAAKDCMDQKHVSCVRNKGEDSNYNIRCLEKLRKHSK